MPDSIATPAPPLHVSRAPWTDALLWLWSLYPVLVPFYLMGRTLNPGTQKFTSGVPQIADYYLACVMLLTLFTLPLRLPSALRPIVVLMAVFVGYTGLVNMAWATELEDLSLLKSTLFYAYDLCLFVTFLLLYERFGERFLKVAIGGVIASVLLQVVLSPIAQQGMSRQALFFNDENQLGYYCVVAGTIFAAACSRYAISTVWQALFYGIVGYLTFLSQCRGALVAFGVLMVVASLERPMRLLVVLGGVALVAFIMTLDPSVLTRSEQRLVIAGEYDSAEGRGYDRMANHSEYLILGAGEGAYERFRSALFASEIHSSFGTLVFCYGIIGASLFAAALLWLGKISWRMALYLIPPFVYGSAHHGVRAAIFWLTLAVLCCLADCERRDVRGEGRET